MYLEYYQYQLRVSLTLIVTTTSKQFVIEYTSQLVYFYLSLSLSIKNLSIIYILYYIYEVILLHIIYIIYIYNILLVYIIRSICQIPTS
jgi:hypothetical protein